MNFFEQVKPIELGVGDGNEFAMVIDQFHRFTRPGHAFNFPGLPNRNVHLGDAARARPDNSWRRRNKIRIGKGFLVDFDPDRMVRRPSYSNDAIFTGSLILSFEFHAFKKLILIAVVDPVLVLIEKHPGIHSRDIGVGFPMNIVFVRRIRAQREGDGSDQLEIIWKSSALTPASPTRNTPDLSSSTTSLKPGS